ncbi:MAG: hypothetical protein ACMXYC_01695 [Candidatus Woesearchaeota archaeon]
MKKVILIILCLVAMFLVGCNYSGLASTEVNLVGMATERQFGSSDPFGQQEEEEEEEEDCPEPISCGAKVTLPNGKVCLGTFCETGVCAVNTEKLQSNPDVFHVRWSCTDTDECPNNTVLQPDGTCGCDGVDEKPLLCCRNGGESRCQGGEECRCGSAYGLLPNRCFSCIPTVAT